jgi:hypothetical protein
MTKPSPKYNEKIVKNLNELVRILYKINVEKMKSMHSNEIPLAIKANHSKLYNKIHIILMLLEELNLDKLSRSKIFILLKDL